MAKLARVQAALLDWYAREGRDLPWRQTRDPYRILVAEIMLQQTQVDRVIPKWRAWLERFPTLAELARASKADAIRCWQGLGYNMRAVRLHAIACQAVAEYGGQLPRTIDGLMSLKGIGRYTASAVACFAYEQPVAMVDTNVRRVLSRVFGVDPPDVDKMADRVVPARAAYAWGQALMDLGATLCRADRPLCLMCPLMTECGGPRPGRRRHSNAAGGFKSSDRYLRGRIVDELRRVPASESVSVAALAERIGGRSAELLVRMADEGLVELVGEASVRLPE